MGAAPQRDWGAGAVRNSAPGVPREGTPYGRLASARAPDGAYMRSWLSRGYSWGVCERWPSLAGAVRSQAPCRFSGAPKAQGFTAHRTRETIARDRISLVGIAPSGSSCGKGLSRFQGSPVSWVQALAAQTYIRSGIDPFQGPSCCCEGKQGSKGGLDHSPSRRLSAMRRTGHTSHLGISISAAVGLPVDYCPQPLRTAPCGIMPVSR